jgi:hypothetical protein
MECSLKRRLKDWVKGIFGVPSATVTAASWDISKVFDDDTWESILEHVYSATGDTDQESFPPWLSGPMKEFIETAWRLGRCNKRLIASSACSFPRKVLGIGDGRGIWALHRVNGLVCVLVD